MDTPPLPFSARLRAATQGAHTAAEGQRYVTALVAGELDLAGYLDLVVQHHALYQALESAAEAMRADPVAGVFVDDALTRLPALEADLTALAGPDWARRTAPDPATVAYVERIRAVAGTSPVRFVAHHYTRYLGDLSGGLHIGRAVARRYGLTGQSGAAFYTFARIDRPKAYKEAYRARLDAMALSPADEAALLDEVLVAYRHNSAVFAALARHVPVGPVLPEVVA
ncbi:heme oxygenase (biliverdin-producing) [Micromonospora sp. HUAS LYJ1]|uniref:biliverdin-producing heme oxygenase n=1 Tax=Micromonospora sp. HUAS LYJ1 TaxID=3061626 RepID=UPI0026731BC0|nr:biliverdin-producing heme oxygenase [Micromonospora sp. HUAS LYJ1]WKU06881.1 biliverdin-producing heme oxygenase [Micromonospora sp. HUAS LYJ1]